MIVNELTLPSIYKKERAKPTGKRFELTFGEGLSLRVSSKGVFTWQCRFRLDGRQHRIDFGRYPDLTVRQAISQHKGIKESIKDGHDPRENVPREIKTVLDLCDYWYIQSAEERRRRPEIARRSLDVDIIPEIGRKSLVGIKTIDVHRCLRKIVERGSKTQAIKTLSLLKQIFLYGESLGLVEKSPVSSIKKRDVCELPKPKRRCLDDREILTLLTKLKDNILSEQFALSIKILIFTGQRRNELRVAEWSEVDLGKKEWFIPAAKNKSNRDHVVYLSSSVKSFFIRLKALGDGSNWVVPNLSNIKRPYSERALTRAINRNQDKLGLEKWCPHDLRRSFVTGVNALGTQIHITEKIVNHTLEGMLKIYDTGNYEAQRNKAMQKWDEHLCSLA